MHFLLTRAAGAFLSILFGSQPLSESPNVGAAKDRYPVAVELSRIVSEKEHVMIRVILQIASDAQIYANPVAHPEMENLRTTVRVFSKDKELRTTIEYPPGDVLKFGKEECRVYRDRAEIRFSIPKALLRKTTECTVWVQPVSRSGTKAYRPRKFVVPMSDAETTK
jgi:hypothetical protein